MVFPRVLSLGSFFLNLYSQPVSDKISEHNISCQKFADDTQLHKRFQPTEFQCSASDFESCFSLLTLGCSVTSSRSMIKKIQQKKPEAMLVDSRQTINLTKAEAI